MHSEDCRVTLSETLNGVMRAIFRYSHRYIVAVFECDVRDHSKNPHLHLALTKFATTAVKLCICIATIPIDGRRMYESQRN